MQFRIKETKHPCGRTSYLRIAYETEQDMLESVQYIATTGIQGIKIHLSHFKRYGSLSFLSEKQPFPFAHEEKYINALEILLPEMIIHRLTGDGARNLLFAPKWSKQKAVQWNPAQAKEKKYHQGYAISSNNKTSIPAPFRV